MKRHGYIVQKMASSAKPERHNLSQSHWRKPSCGHR